MKAKKSFRILANKQFPDGTYLSYAFETELEVDISDPAELERIADTVYKATYADIKRRAKTDPGVGVVWKNLQRQLKLEKQREAAEE